MNAFEKWVISNYIGAIMLDPPPNLQEILKTHVFIKINGKQYKVPLKDIPKEFL